MGDLAPRPRGGWQVGSSFRRAARSEPIYSVDCPDVYAVEWSPNRTRVRVKHYRRAEDTVPCCVVDVTRQRGESDDDMLHRAHPPFALCARDSGEASR